MAEKKSSILDALTDMNQFKNNNASIGSDLPKKLLEDGDNTFRVVGMPYFFYMHTFTSPDGTPRISVCVKDDDGNGECRICKKRKEAKRALDKHERGDIQLSRTEQHELKIITGDADNPNLGFAQSWNAKRMVALQVIDRDSNINIKSKQLCILCKNEYIFGISASNKGIYTSIVRLYGRHRQELKEHFAKGHDWVPFDIILTKDGKGKNTSYDKEKGESSPLTKAELAYKRHDLSKVLAPTPDKVLEGWLVKTEVEEDDDGDEVIAAPRKKVKDEPVVEDDVVDDDENDEVITAPRKKVKDEPVVEDDVVEDDVVEEEPVVHKKPKKESTEKPSRKVKKAKKEEEEDEDDIFTSLDGDDANVFDELDEIEEKPKKLEKKLTAKSKPVEKKEKKKKEVEMDNCPSCDKLIPVSSTKCEYCGCEFEGYEEVDEIPF